MHKHQKPIKLKPLHNAKHAPAMVGGCKVYLLAFENSLQANIIHIVSTGKIILANASACKLLGYSCKELLAQTRSTIFNITESSFKKMMKQRRLEGHSKALVTVIRKNGKHLPCEITSALFMDEDGVENSITTIVDISERILEQNNIDIQKEKIVADNIDLANNKQKQITDEREKVVAEDIVIAQEQEIRLKEKQIEVAMEDAKETERSDIGKELHDNVNQLLGTSRLYLSMAKQGGEEGEMYLNRSSDYMLSAIEEIRKLTKALTTDAIKHLGLAEAIADTAHDIMEINSMKISCSTESFVEDSVNSKFKLNVYRIVQEQLNNILKHAIATKVVIKLLQDKKSIRLSISDNGVGFDLAKKREGIGITNIKSRAGAYNAKIDFTSQPGQGCVLTIVFPFQKCAAV